MFRDYDYIYFDSSLVEGSSELEVILNKIEKNLLGYEKKVTLLSSVINEAWDFCMGDTNAYKNMCDLEEREGSIIEFDTSDEYDSLEAAITNRIGYSSQILITRDVPYAMRILELNEHVSSNYLAVGIVNNENEIDLIRVLSEDEVEESTKNSESADITGLSPNGVIFKTADDVANAILELKKQIKALQKLERTMRSREEGGDMSA